MKINFAKVNKWVYKTIIPVGLAIAFIIIAISTKGDFGAVFGAIAAIITPLLALLDKLQGQISSGDISGSADTVVKISDVLADEIKNMGKGSQANTLPELSDPFVEQINTTNGNEEK